MPFVTLLRHQSYLPSILTVFVSWVSFWMDIESVPGRISLGVVTLLAMSSQAGQGIKEEHNQEYAIGSDTPWIMDSGGT